MALGLLTFLGCCRSAQPPMTCEVKAKIDRVRPSAESPLYATVELRLANPARVACRVLRFRVAWPGGVATFEPRDLRVGPGAVATRHVRIDPDRGDVKALLSAPDAATVAILDARAD